MTYWLKDVDELLRGDRTRPQMLAERGLELQPGRLIVVIVAMSMIYGLCMGSFSLLKDVSPELADRSDRYLQVVASMVKTPALFFLTLAVTLPSLYVFNALVGSRLRLTMLLKLLIASLAVNTTVLASLGTVVAFFSVSTSSHPFIVLLNVAVFAVAGVLGLMFLLQTLHRLTTAARRQKDGTGVDDVQLAEAVVVADEPAGSGTANASARAEDPSALDMPQGDVLAKHTRTVFRCWVVLFALVGAQMGWVLRPFIGSPQLPFTWFRERHSNFFAGVLRALGDLLFGGN
ncbi:MAG: hypothetical protein H0T51_12515 [Pirellulales bacterium]|nr:hypothetical protein [Pirellulales bacterium]